MGAPPGVYQGTADALAALMLLLEFGMLRQALVRDQVRLYAAQSALISVLAVVIAANRNLPDLYLLAVLSGLLKVVAAPLVLRRLLPGSLSGSWVGGGLNSAPGDGPTSARELAAKPPVEEPSGVAGSHTLSPASAVLASLVLAAFGFFAFGFLHLSGAAGSADSATSGVPPLALAIAAAMVFVAFGLMIVRRDVASQAVGFFSLENAISLAALVLAAGMPLILETAFLFDLLVAVVVFGMLMRAHHVKAASLSTADLTRLRG
jgi:hydrogenase-4 component E